MGAQVLQKRISHEASDIEILTFLEQENVNWSDVEEIKQITNLNDDIIADWFNVNVKTFRNYRALQKSLNPNLKERVVLTLLLLQHGLEVFGSREAFRTWLNTPNFLLDKRAPLSFLSTISGIRFIDDRLTAMEYGDNA